MIEQIAKTITVANFGGGSAAQMLQKLFTHFPKNSRIAVAELPCLGLPHLAYTLESSEITKLPKEKTIDQLLLDYDMKDPSSLSEYFLVQNNIHYLLTNPRGLPENPVVRKIKSNQTLINFPLFLKKKLQNSYDYIVFLSSGTLSNPMTHFSLRIADVVVLHSSSALEFVGNYTHFKKIHELFGVAKERLFLFSADNNMSLKDETVYTKYSELVSQINKSEYFELEWNYSAVEKVTAQESVGNIDPVEYLDYKFQQSEMVTVISDSETEMLEPLTNWVRQQLQEKYLEEYVRSLTNEEARQKVRYYISDLVREQTEFPLSISMKQTVEWVQKDITSLFIQEILDDGTISSIEINGPDQVIVEQNGMTKHLEHIRFANIDHLYQTINKMLLPIGKPISSSEPVVDANYRGFRICVVADNKEYQGISAKFPLISIRKFPPDVYSDEDCVTYGLCSSSIIEFEKFIVKKDANIIASGGTNSGKTAHLIRLPQYRDRLDRIISIEDSEEMMLSEKEVYKNYPNLPSMLVKDIEDKQKSYGIDKLIKASLRLNPDVLIIGEIRDEPAAKQALIGMNTGHVLYSTIHANSAEKAATRFLQLNGNTLAAASQVAGSIDLIIFQKKLKNGKRVVTEISELLGYVGTETPILNPIFKYNNATQKHEQVGRIKSPDMIEKILLHEPDPRELDRWCDLSAVKTLEVVGV